MIEFILGVSLGGTISWILTHKYSTRSILEENQESMAVDVINAPIEKVWEYISKPKNFKWFRHLDSTNFSHQNIKKGASFKSKSIISNTEITEFVVEWNPPNEFRWGISPDNWTTAILLTNLDKKTEVCIVNRYRHRSWQDILWGKIFERDIKDWRQVHQGLTDRMIKKLKIQFN